MASMNRRLSRVKASASEPDTNSGTSKATNRSVRETVTKVVGELSKEGVIDSGYGKITLVNVPALRAIANA